MGNDEEQRIKDLEDTVNLMKSDDYEDRFKAEYFQLKLRIEKLDRILIKDEAGTLGFQLSCSKEILEDQKYYMEEYLRVLRVRAEKEGIKL